MATQPHCGAPRRSACVALASQLGGSLRGRLSSPLQERGTFQGGAQKVAGPHLPTHALSLTFTPQPLWSHRVSCRGRGQGEGVEVSLLTPQTGPTHAAGALAPPTCLLWAWPTQASLRSHFPPLCKIHPLPASNCAVSAPRLLFPLLFSSSSRSSWVALVRFR